MAELDAGCAAPLYGAYAFCPEAPTTLTGGLSLVPFAGAGAVIGVIPNWNTFLLLEYWYKANTKNTKPTIPKTCSFFKSLKNFLKAAIYIK